MRADQVSSDVSRMNAQPGRKGHLGGGGSEAIADAFGGLPCSGCALADLKAPANAETLMGADDLKASANAEAHLGADVLLPAAEGRGKGAFFDASPFCPCAGAAAVLLAIEESPGAPAHRARVILQKPHH